MVVVFEHLRDDLGIRFRNELHAAAHQVVFEVQVIFDDAVVHDGKFAALARLRVRIDVARRAVRRPARVPDAERARHRFAAVDQVAEHAEPALRLRHTQAILRIDRHAGGIIPAVLELLEPLQKNRRRLFASNIADNTTHTKIPSFPLPHDLRQIRESGRHRARFPAKTNYL